MVVAYVVLADRTINELLEKLTREITLIVTDAGNTFIDDTNSDLRAAEAGDKILGLLVTDHRDGRIELQYRDYLKFGFAKVRFAIDDQLDHGPQYFHNIELRAVLGDIRISKDGSYDLALGYGFDKGPPAFEAARATIKLKTPPISIDAFVAGSPDNGFVIDFGIGTSNSGSSRFPLVIPLGPSGFALQGIGGTFADRFRPNLSPTSEDGIEPERPTAFDYIRWAQEQSRKPLDGWRPLRADEGNAGGVGLRTDIIDLCTSGGLIRIRDAGFLALSDGPVVVQGGRGQVFSLPPDSFRLDVVSALDFRTLTYATAGAAALRLPGDPDDWELMAARGSISAQVSLLNSRDWFFNVGTDGAPITGTFLKDWFTAEVFCMTNFDRIYVGAKLTFGGRNIDIFGIKLDAYFGMQSKAKLGFQPLHFEGSLILFGGIGLRIWKFKIGVELSGIVSLAVLKPFHLRIQAGWKISLPWPLSDMRGTITLLDVDNPLVAAIAMPILLPAALATAGDYGGVSVAPNQELGAIHTLTGRQFDVDNETSSIWPDCELALPFYRKLTDETGKVLSPPVGSSREGAVSVTHRLTGLDIFQIRDDGSEVHVNDVQGVWIAGPAAREGDYNSPTARLHFPANDPFKWLDQYQDRSEQTEIIPPTGTVFDFGVGPAEFGLSELQLPTVRIRRVVETGIDLLSDQAFGLPTRVARISHVKFEMQNDATASNLLSKAVVTCVAWDEDSFAKLRSDRYLQILSVTEHIVPSGETIYFGRVEISDGAGNDFTDFSLEYQPEGRCAAGVTAPSEHCFALAAVYRVTLFEGRRTITTIKERTVLSPGKYRIAAAGSSNWSSSRDHKSGSWAFGQTFNVVYPPTITPYIAYVTIGDERPYGTRGGGVWNPTPYGLGFPIYTAHIASVVFRTDYMRSIFPNIRVTHDKTEPATEFLDSKIHESFESASSTKWASDRGADAKPCQEILFDVPRDPGVRELTLSFFNPLANKTVKLDAWSFETSRFESISSHLHLTKPFVTTARSTIFEQSASVDEAITKLDVSTVSVPARSADAIPAPWRLPPAFTPEHRHFEPQAALSFLHFFERSAIPISRVNGDALEGLMERPDSTEIEALCDRDGKAFCLWVRSPEPLDWRRLSAEIVVYDIGRNPDGSPFLPEVAPVRLTAVFTPSPDGTSALLFARINETYIRLPAGIYVLAATFALNVPGLAHLRTKSDPPAKTETFKIRFANTFGLTFRGALN